MKEIDKVPFKWGSSNIDEIAKAMCEVREFNYWMAINEDHYEKTKYYRSSNFTLSEMPLCGSLNFISPPDGYNLIGGSVIYTDEGTQKQRGHWFYASFGGKEIICLTPGQFIDPSIELKKGERILILSQKAPGLVHVLNEEIAMLAGTRDEIFSKLGLNYLLPEDYFLA